MTKYVLHIGKKKKLSLILKYLKFKYFLYGGNVLFSKYFHQYFFGNKWGETLKSQEALKTRNLIKHKSHIPFLEVEIEIEN